MTLEKPELNGANDRENIQKLGTWASNLVDSLNYILNHMDSTNLVPGMGFITEEKVNDKMEQQYQELREFIVRRTKGE